MNERSLTILEFPKILERLATRTSFSVGRELALALRPTSDRKDIMERLAITSEGRRLLEIKPNAGLGGAHDIRSLIKRAKLGGRIEPNELLEVLGTIQCGSTLRTIIVRLEDQLVTLGAKAHQISECSKLEQDIVRCISDRAEVLSEASAALAHIRGSLRGTRGRLLDRLTQMLSSEALHPMIQEAIITQREGRYVIPVKAEFKGKFRGIVHDQSASGATVFIEPLATVDLNNRIRELELDEEREIDRILRDLSTHVAGLSEELERNVAILAELDLAIAKARYANELKAAPPELVDISETKDQRPSLEFFNARHPLLSGHVVPISIRLGGEASVLVITGPNTGGKTVALKTVGLLTVMTQAGLHIPADEGSRVPVLRQVFADIGDEQSIEQSLSTFSSHMRNVVNLLRDADSRSLVLLDELGAGTDPAEGSALAQSILDYLLERSVLVVATTHYSELKSYAHLTPRVQNASVEFDLDTLTPTYRLTIGLPGRSNALAIATRLGLLKEIIDAAQERMNPSTAAVERLLGEIQDERDRAVEERSAAQQKHAEGARIKAGLQSQLAAIEREREAILAAAREEARTEAERELAEVREQLRAALDAANTAVPDRMSLLAGLRETHRVARQIEDRRAQEEQRPRVGPVEPPRKGPLHVGDSVLVGSLGQQGELLSLPGQDGHVEVQIGNFKLRVRSDDIQRVGRRAERLDSQPIIHLENRPSVPLEIEVRGWRAEDVPPVIDQYVHDAYLAGLPYVRIIHGKGTGVLRRLVREQLSNNPLVRALRHPEPQQGGEGVTVVELAG